MFNGDMSEEVITAEELAEFQKAAGITQPDRNSQDTLVHRVAPAKPAFVKTRDYPEQKVHSFRIGSDGQVVDRGTPIERHQAEKAALRKERGEVLIGSDTVLIEGGLYLVTDIHKTEDGELAFGVKRQATEADPNAPYRPDNKTEVHGSDMLNIARSENNQPPSILVNIPGPRVGDVDQGWIFGGIGNDEGTPVVDVYRFTPVGNEKSQIEKRRILVDSFLQANGASIEN